jgi:glycosyltransferase involved in cell wall biosynthesis
MRIAILTELFLPHTGGTEYRLYEIAKRLVRKGHEISVFTVRCPPDAAKEEDLDGIRVVRYARSPRYVTANGLRSVRGVIEYSLYTALKAIGADYDVYYFGEWPMFHSLLAGPLVHPSVQEWCEVWYRQIVVLEKILAKVMSNHVAVSEFTKRRMVDLLRVDPENIVVIPNGVDFHRFNGSGGEKTWGRLVYVGRIAPHKGLKMLIDSFKMARDKNGELELFIGGSGPLLPTIREYAKEAEGIHILGKITEEEKIALLKSSWLFMMPSIREGLPLAPLEAMAGGTPVLTVDHPDNGVRDMCVDGNGIIAPPDSVSIASAVLKVLSNEGQWNMMREASLRYAKKCSWDTVTDKVEVYFDSIANGA